MAMAGIPVSTVLVDFEHVADVFRRLVADPDS